MSIRALCRALKELRASSHWHTQEDFSRQIGLCRTRYDKLEQGEQIPTRKTIERILGRLNPRAEVSAKLLELWGLAKLESLGVDLPKIPACKIDLDALSKKIQSEVSYILKQEGIILREATKRVVKNRVAMILKSSLGD